jgi:hypothetical protein
MEGNLSKIESDIDVLRSEHLKEGIRPIIASVESINTFPVMPNPGDVVYVDLYANKEEVLKNGLKKEGNEDYVISQVDENDKFSHSFADCTGIIAVGLETKSGHNISFMSHQNPEYFLNKKVVKFVVDLQHSLGEIKNRCEEGTIDVIIIGGRYAKVRDYGQSNVPDKDIFIREYINSIKLISGNVRDELGFYPVIIGGPKLSPSYDNVFLDTQNRRLYIKRNNEKSTPDFLESFNADDIDEVSKSWKPGEWGLPI